MNAKMQRIALIATPPSAIVGKRKQNSILAVKSQANIAIAKLIFLRHMQKAD